MNPAALAAPHDVDRRAVLHRLLDDSLAFAPEHGGTMANHLPMALAALDGLGADEPRMRAFFASYARRLDRAPARAEPPAIVGDWKRLRGRIESFDALRHGFAAAIDAHGRDAVLHDAVPALIDGAAGTAFHGPIRAAHAVESEHAGELAAALAYWAARWTPLPAPGAARALVAGAGAWLEALDARRVEADPAWRAGAPMISDRMQQAARTASYVELAGALDTRGAEVASLLLDLARAAAARYAATGNFTVLHLATAARALRVLSAWLPADIEALAPALHAVAAACLAACAAPLADDVAGLPLAWADVRRLACASDDDHVVKLVHAMAMQHERAPDTVWLVAARRGVTK